MNDREVSATMMASYALWTIGAGLMIAGTFDLRFMGWGLFLSAAAATCTIRRMICQMESKARNAFDLGRDYARSPSSVRSLR